LWILEKFGEVWRKLSGVMEYLAEERSRWEAEVERRSLRAKGRGK
jgi:hypothetical protein